MPPMLRNLHITNADGRDATVQFHAIKAPKPPPKGLPDRAVRFRRYLSATDACSHDALTARFGADYAQALIDGDPEVDVELVGRDIGATNVVQLSSKGEILYSAPQVVEVLVGPDGQELERRQPEDTPANVNDEMPVRWTGRKLARSEVVRRYVFRRTLQLRHVDGLSYDYLHAMASELHEGDQVVLVGAGPRGRNPLIFQVNGSPYRGFLEGKVDGTRYQLLLHLSNMELKRPVVEQEDTP